MQISILKQDLRVAGTRGGIQEMVLEQEKKNLSFLNTHTQNVNFPHPQKSDQSCLGCKVKSTGCWAKRNNNEQPLLLNYLFSFVHRMLVAKISYHLGGGTGCPKVL